MSGKEQSPPRKPVAKKKQRTDARVRRTHERLGMALLQLICEKPMDQVTVQEVLERAAVGRSTFYQHFRDKNDLLLSQLEKALEHMSTLLMVRREQSDRIVAVTEIFEHIGGQNKVYRALVDACRLHDFYDLAQDFFARGIERRLKESKRLPKMPPRELRARSHVLAGGLLSLLRWWIDHGEKESPAEMDKLFHQMVWKGLPLSDS